MPLTKKQLQKIEATIRKRLLGVSYEMFGERALTTDEIETLKRAGLLRGNVRNFTSDSWNLGRVVSLIDRDAATGLSYNDVMDRVREMAIPTTRIEQAAIKWAEEHSGQYIRGLTDDMVKEVRTATSRVAGSAIRAVQDEVVEAIRDRKTISELKTALWDAIDDRGRDFRRIAFTEMNESIQRGIASEIRRNSTEGGEQLVFKRPNPDACKHCVRAYLEDDGITPKVFKLSDLAESNIGRKAASWLPTIGSIHPWCQCQLQVIPEGYSFVKRRRDNGEKLAVDGKEARGIGYDAIMEFTGETARPSSIGKSMSFSDNDDAEHSCTY